MRPGSGTSVPFSTGAGIADSAPLEACRRFAEEWEVNVRERRTTVVVVTNLECRMPNAASRHAL